MDMTTLVQAGIKGGNAHKHYWTDDERDIVRRDYDGTNKTSHLIAIKLSYMAGDKITFFAVKGQTSLMGICRDKSPDWSEREVEILSELICQYSPITIARRLHRSVNAVVVKSKRLGLKRRFRDGWFTKREVCEIMGVDHHRIQRFIDDGSLVASYHTGQKPQKNGMAMWHIKTKDLKEFIKKNASDFQGRNVDLVMIVWLLNGDV